MGFTYLYIGIFFFSFGVTVEAKNSARIIRTTYLFEFILLEYLLEYSYISYLFFPCHFLGVIKNKKRNLAYFFFSMACAYRVIILDRLQSLFFFSSFFLFPFCFCLFFFFSIFFFLIVFFVPLLFLSFFFFLDVFFLVLSI